jgi:hypothetical protein
MAKREKLVYKNISEIAHLWAHERQEYARCGNAYYEKDIIYSYGRHFPIARIHTNKKGEKTVLFTLDTYSSTTAQHIRDVDRACSHMNRLYMIDIPTYGDPNHSKNIEYWLTLIANNLGKIDKARDNKLYLLRAAQSELAQMDEYLLFYKLKDTKEVKVARKSIADPKWELQIKEYNEKKAAREQYEQENWDEVQQKKDADRRKRAETKQIKLLEKYREQIDKWRTGESYRIPYTYNGGTLLRYNSGKNRIETSKGVEVPVEAAKRLYNRIQKVNKQGGCADNCTDKILDYAVNEIAPTHIKVGCHTIATEEIESMAKQLQWI